MQSNSEPRWHRVPILNNARVVRYIVEEMTPEEAPSANLLDAEWDPPPSQASRRPCSHSSSPSSNYSPELVEITTALSQAVDTLSQIRDVMFSYNVAPDASLAKQAASASVRVSNNITNLLTNIKTKIPK